METGAGGNGSPGVGAPDVRPSVNFAPGDPSSKLLELERTLAAKDAVMEPGVMGSLRTYVASGGKPAAAIELLSENYRGYAQMSSLVCGWLELTEENEPSAHKHAGRVAEFSPLSPVAQLKDRGGDASAAATPRYYGDEEDTPQGGTTAARVDTTPPGSGFAAGGGAGAAVAEALESWRGRVRWDEIFFLEQLIRKTFDPRLVDAVKGQPTWLTQLLHSDRGRGVLFSLAEKHPNCLLISVAIQHAWQHGHADEVKALGPAAASYFSIFHELLADHFRALIGAGDDEVRLAEATGAIRTACCQSLATYLFAQMMLADLANGGDAGLGSAQATQSRAFATRVSQELRAAAAAVHGASVVRRIAPLLAASDADAAAATVVGDLLQAAEDFKRRRGTGHAAFPTDTLRKLRAMYLDDDEERAAAPSGGVAAARFPEAPERSSASSKKPSTAPLRSPELLRALLDEAFRWDPSADPARGAEARARCLDLIATATCAEDEFREVREKLAAVFDWCAGTTRGVPLALEEGSSPFLETVRHPVPAAGALAWVKSTMGNPEHYKQVHAAANTAAYLHVVSETCKAHPRLRLEALETVTAAISAMGKGANEQTHTATLDVAVELVEHGLVLPALRAASEKWKRVIDPSLLRYFAGEVLEVAGPPYSGAFAAAALELLRVANAGKGMTRACDEFVEQCRRQRARGALQPPLSKDLDEVLDRLSGSGRGR